MCRRYNIRAVFKTPFTLHHQLMRVKDTDPLEKRAGVVYRLPCSECEFSYIGETKRSLETRLRAHKAVTKRGEVQMSAVAEHAWTNQHQPLWGNVRVLDTATNKTILTIKEAMHIHMAKSSSSSASSLMNRDCGVPVADCWKPILNRACHATPTFS